MNLFDLEKLDVDDFSTGYGVLNNLLLAAKRENAKLTPEERAEIRARNKELQIRKIRMVKVIKNICPECDGKLKRGKKEKVLSYKRTWNCSCCEKRFVDTGEKVTL
ncbi:hypothetical protein ACI2JA_03820 [Alkalihalobacillus sp. NPDC078783]